MSTPDTYRARVRASLSIDTIVVLLIAAGVTAFAVVDAASDVYGRSPWGDGMVLGPSIVVGYATLQLAWKGTDAVLAQWGARVFGLNFIATVVCTLAFAVTFALTPVTFGPGGDQHWFSEGWDTLVFPSLLGFSFALLTTMVAMVFVVVPVMAIRRPQQLGSANMLDDDPRYASRNRRAGLAFALLLMLALAVPTLIVGFDGVLETIGWLLAPAALVISLVVAFTQKTDRARRRAAGVSSLPDQLADAGDS